MANTRRAAPAAKTLAVHGTPTLDASKTSGARMPTVLVPPPEPACEHLLVHATSVVVVLAGEGLSPRLPIPTSERPTLLPNVPAKSTSARRMELAAVTSGFSAWSKTPVNKSDPGEATYNKVVVFSAESDGEWKLTTQ